MKNRIFDFPDFRDVLSTVASQFDMSSRYANVGDIIGHEIKGGILCRWCQSGDKLGHHAKRYCSDNCKMSAYIWTAPQKPLAKAYIMIERQSCACVLCGISYEDQLIRYMDRIESNTDRTLGDGKVRLFGVGNFLSQRCEIDVDHIIPLHKGGQGLGLDNVQAVCRRCHKEKTYQDGRR